MNWYSHVGLDYSIAVSSVLRWHLALAAFSDPASHRVCVFSCLLAVGYPNTVQQGVCGSQVEANP